MCWLVHSCYLCIAWSVQGTFFRWQTLVPHLPPPPIFNVRQHPLCKTPKALCCSFAQHQLTCLQKHWHYFVRIVSLVAHLWRKYTQKALINEYCQRATIIKMFKSHHLPKIVVSVVQNKIKTNKGQCASLFIHVIYVSPGQYRVQFFSIANAGTRFTPPPNI